ncbi:MAG: hypothetical protein EXX96DRAFT_14061 [Benjaminiella poitrasii]|nr:MAG: hypothetical protein EXX96DRAFT_14061 [Benjaminiella poitrasii]
MCTNNNLHTLEFILWNTRLTSGVPTCVRYQGSSIVSIFLTTDGLHNPSLTVCENFSLDSDHKMMDSDLQLTTLPNSVLENPRLIWYLSKLQKSHNRERYVATFQQEYARQLPHYLEASNQSTTLATAQIFI